MAASVAGLGAPTCSGDGRFAVEWTEVALSDDRRAVTVTNYYGPFCAIAADGVDVDVTEDEIVVTAWMRVQTDDDGTCDASCESVTQTAVLDEPLPSALPVVQRSGVYLGCGS